MRRERFAFQRFSPKQQAVLYWWQDGSPYADYDILVADGAIRSGKTISVICSFLQFTQKRFSGETFIIAGKSIGALKRNVIKPMLQILGAWGWEYTYIRSGVEHITIGTNTYYLFGASNEASQDTLQGLTAAGALADEVALMPQSFVDQMIGRCSVDGAKVFMNCNPRHPLHWFKTEFIDKAQEKLICYLHFTMDDNLSLADKVKERFRRMFSGVFYRRYILGLWVRAEGVIYDMFDKAKHVVPVLVGRRYSELYVSCDYGTQNPMVFQLWGHVVGANDPQKGKWVCVREYYYDGRKLGSQKTDAEYYDDLVEFVGDAKVRSIIIDPSAASFIATVRKANRFHVRKGKNAVLAGIRNVSTALSLELIAFSEVCKHSIQEHEGYAWDEKAIQRGDEAPLKQDDHAPDATRYFVSTVLFSGGTGVLK